MLALQNGVDVKTLSGMLGHYSTAFTLDVYGHVSAQMQADAAQKMGGFSKMEGSKSVVHTNKELTHVLGRADWSCHALSLN